MAYKRSHNEIQEIAENCETIDRFHEVPDSNMVRINIKEDLHCKYWRKIYEAGYRVNGVKQEGKFIYLRTI